MKLITDLHIHGRFSRACSKNLDFANLEKYARIKGIHLMGTGDFSHPKWGKEIRTDLEEKEKGIYRTKTGFPFLLTNEISLMYSQGGKGRRVHLVLFAPNLDVVDQITDYLKSLGRIDYDGRPIFGKSVMEVTESLKAISRDIEIIPAHAWTPWFGILGSKGGFDSMEEAFGDQVKHIHALETGLSSDPPMNWRVSSLDKFSLLSFSDLHSYWPWRIGREATIFDLKKLNYANLIKSIRSKKGLEGTIEVEPAYGKYHWDGHRKCGVVLNPKQTKKAKGICPKCKRALTIGVEYRVEEMADRKEGFVLKGGKKFWKLLPLSELISAVYDVGVGSKTVEGVYNKLIKKFENEFDILLNVEKNKLVDANEKLADVIIKNREGKIKVEPGYDGVYGKLKDIEKIKVRNRQKGLGDFS
jgi:uncharacterized protein (TIGR00375 family)